ncbi:MAG: signal peptidase I [Alphaproteobacteria bacterium]|nr:signal peptidase I [Alphaproteobacteria bacterium]MBU2082725.1 signal peptidase I [Alphaproteobacteria bacterium]MBU2143827.1 signal peptidase I [Alphaproteobacteria bacterium]MBU2196779.1 signal peptidase I [Alphaproteobacteria bacterium]
MADDGEKAHSVDEDASLTFGQKVKRELHEWAVTLAVFIPIFMIFSGLLYEQRVIPSESMVPSLQVSDRVAVSKFAYGYDRYSLPFSLGRYLPIPEGRIFARTPKRGDVVVFEHPHTARVMIKRVIGLPGDRIQMIGEALYINGEPIESEFLRTLRYVPHGRSRAVTAYEWRETAENGKSWLTHRQEKGDRGDNTVLFVVPAGHLFLMGDNRDNSLDSRFLSGHCPPIDGVVDRVGCPLSVQSSQASVGFVPMDHLVGRAETVIMSLYRCKFEDDEPCKKRVWRGL